MQKKLFLLLMLIAAGSWAGAQVDVSAQVDKTSLALDDELTLTVEVSGVAGNVVMPQLPSLPAFNVYSREVEQSSINGETSLRFRYVMLPRFVGNATIGAVTFNYNGQTYQTEPIAVQIYRTTANVPAPRATAQTAPAPVQQADPHLPPLDAALANLAYAKAGTPFFLVAAVSNKHPYVNEPFVLGVRFYYSQAFHDAPYQKPTVSNLFMEDETTREGSQTISGTLYRYQEQRYQLTAAAAGKATIGPASVRYHTGSGAFSAFDRFFGGLTAGPEKTAMSSPISLEIRALPQAGKPDSFYGAVGRGYTLKAYAQPQQVPAGEAVNLSVVVKGPANVKSTQNLNFPTLDGFKIYPAAPTSGAASAADGTRQTAKTFKAVLVPAASGIYTVPAIPWSYFDPESGTYKTLHTAPLTLTVTPAEKTESGASFSGIATGNGVQKLARDIAYLKMGPAPTDDVLTRLSQLDQVNWGVLLLVIVAGLFAGLGRRSLARKKIFLTAKSHLKHATSCQAISDSVSTYLQQKLHLSTASLPLKEMVLELRAKGVTPATAQAFALLWQRLEAERFAPSGSNAQHIPHLAAQALDVLKLIEEETK